MTKLLKESSEAKFDQSKDEDKCEEEDISTIYMSHFKAKMIPTKMAKFNQHQFDRLKYYKKPFMLQPQTQQHGNLNEANRKLLNKILQKHKELVEQEKLKKETFQRLVPTTNMTSYKYFGSTSINNVSSLNGTGLDTDSGRHSMAESPSANTILPGIMTPIQNDFLNLLNSKKYSKNDQFNNSSTSPMTGNSATTATGSFTSKCIFTSGNEITFTPQPKQQQHQQQYQQITPSRLVSRDNSVEFMVGKSQDSTADENANKLYSIRSCRSKSINLSEL